MSRSLFLGIESSCDETAIAIVEDKHIVRSSLIASQTELHAVFGGVVPEVASRNHLEAIYPLFERALSEANCSPADLTGIAVTQGPGLIGALLVGCTFAKGLASVLKVPLIPINHVHAHVHGAFLSLPLTDANVSRIFPALSLVISGGHSHMYYMKDPISFELLGYSLDDACGESFDKVAKILGLPYPGGPQIEKLAQNGDKSRVTMPRMIEQKDRLLFSYSGLKTFVYTWAQKNGPILADEKKADIAAAFQEEALGQICRKAKAAYGMRPNVKTIVIAGGVAANQRFRLKLSETMEHLAPEILFPKQTYCSDNAAMIATLGSWTASRPQHAEAVPVDMNWDAFPRYPYGAASL